MLMARNAIRILGVVLLFLGVLILLQPAALADDVQIALTQPPGGNVAYGVYLSPYRGTITPMGGTPGNPVDLICDDFFDNTYMYESWTANVYNGSSSNLSGTRMATVSGLQQSDLDTHYEEVGWLITQLNLHLQADQAAISFAIWDIFGSTAPNVGTADPKTVQQYLTDQGAAAFFADSTTPGGVMYWVNEAGAKYSSFNLSNLIIYSPDTTSGCGEVTCPAQEFVTVNTPETSVTAFLAFDLLALFGVVSLVRRRALWNAGGHH
jgi:hypothetical protein